jgi:tight adherence protein B
MNLVITVAVFIAVLCILEGLVLMMRGRLDPEERKIRKRLKTLSDEPQFQANPAHGATNLNKKRLLSSIQSLHDLLVRIPQLASIDNLLVQSNFKYPTSVFLLFTLLSMFVSYYLAQLLFKTLIIALPVGIAMGSMPYLMATVKKAQRMKKFERQLPEALELVARSLRAGHAFSGGLQMVADEFDEPLGIEFQRTIMQVNMGVSVEQALKNLSARVDCADLKFFAVSVIIHRESGGNLAEILESISNLIRGRFRLRGKIRTLTAEGKLSAGILIAIPVFVALVLFYMNPEYIGILSTDSTGRMLVGAAVMMMILGVAWMKKMITLKI